MQLRSLGILLVLLPAAFGQNLPDAPSAHKFWDRQNKALFAGVVLTRALDVVSTHDFRMEHRNERILSNELVDNEPAFVAFQAGMTAAHVGACYLLHRTGHHKLERAASYVSIGVLGVQVVNNYTHNLPPWSLMPR